MASTDTLLISDPKEHKWVDEIDEIFSSQLYTDVESRPVSIFQLPETITQTKPEAYEPQQFGLGPIHHFRQWPYKKMEQKKLAVMREVLKDCGYESIEYTRFVCKIDQNCVPMVRSCYDMFLQDEDQSLARIFAIDGLFLLNLFHTYNRQLDEYLLSLKNKALVNDFMKSHPLAQNEITVTVDNQDEWEEFLIAPHWQNPVNDAKKRMVAKDILMVENQIPFMVLKYINDTLHSSASASASASSSSLIENFSPSIFRIFCEIHSPLKLCLKSQAPSSVDHLLHYMYYSIVNNVKLSVESPKDNHELDKLFKPKKAIDQVYEYVMDKLPYVHKDKVPKPKTPTAGNVSNLNSKIPQKEIAQAYEQTVSILETFTKSETLIPSASKLHYRAGFHFHSLNEDQGIQDIHINGQDIYLPTLTLNKGSDVILRNLVAYETVTVSSDSFPLSDYMSLMCGLIMNKDDANYLQSRNVIIGDMGADEVAKFFTGMSSSISTMKTKKKSKLQEVIDEVNEVYESRLTTKAYLLLKKLAHWLLVGLTAIGSFVGYAWKIVAFMVSIVTVVILTYQSYCDFFGCNKKTVTLFPYASS